MYSNCVNVLIDDKFNHPIFTLQNFALHKYEWTLILLNVSVHYLKISYLFIILTKPCHHFTNPNHINDPNIQTLYNSSPNRSKTIILNNYSSIKLAHTIKIQQVQISVPIFSCNMLGCFAVIKSCTLNLHHPTAIRHLK